MKIVPPSRLNVLAAALALAGSAAFAAPPTPDPAARKPFYGETHLHTSWSFDAFIFGDTKSTPGDAYDYAKGKPLKNAMGYEMKIKQPLDWMVCDMVEQPRRVAERMATWLREGWCRHTVFHLKLPMKKRWQETQLCLDLFAAQSEKPLTIRAKQLYHDREEITVFATVNKKT